MRRYRERLCPDLNPSPLSRDAGARGANAEGDEFVSDSRRPTHRVYIAEGIIGVKNSARHKFLYKKNICPYEFTLPFSVNGYKTACTALGKMVKKRYICDDKICTVDQCWLVEVMEGKIRSHWRQNFCKK